MTALADMVLVVVGVRPDTALAAAAGAELGVGRALSVDRGMRTNLERVFAAGDCVVTHHRLMGLTHLLLGTTAHKQGRVAGENAIGGSAEFAGSLGTQVVKVFDMVASRTVFATRRRLLPASTRSPPSSRPTTTRRTTRGAIASGCATPGIAPLVGS